MTSLRIERPPAVVEPPPDRGKLMDAKDIASDVYRGRVTACWVRRHVPGKMTQGHRTVIWWQYEVLQWIDSTKEGAA